MRFQDQFQAKEAAQKGANACGQRLYYYQSGRMWEVALQPHPEFSTNPFNYCDPQQQEK